MSGQEAVNADTWDGLPDNPAGAGWHWLRHKLGGEPFALRWSNDDHAACFAWDTGAGGYSPAVASQHWIYLGPIVPPATPARQPVDAELVGLCARYVSACRAFDGRRGLSVAEREALWWEMAAIGERIVDLPACGMAGVMAKAGVARYRAQQPDGTFDFDAQHVGDWPALILRDLLRVHGECTA